MNLLTSKLPGVLSVGLLVLLPRIAFSQIEHPDIALLSKTISKGRVAFTYELGGKKDAFALSFANGEIKPLHASSADDEFPVYSKDGKAIAFYSDESGDREVYVADSDGKNPRRLTNSPGIDEDPDWSPDGKRLAFRSEREKGSNIYLMNADGSKQSRLTSGTSTKSVPRWAPQGDKILFSTNDHWPGWDIDMIELSTGTITSETSGIRTFCHAAWNPQGTGFLYSHGGGSVINLWRKNLDGSADERLTEYDGKDYDAAWVDASKILFVREMTKGKEDYQIFLIELPEKKITQITKNTGAIRDLSYTPYD